MIDVFVINLDPATRSPCYTPEQPCVGHSLFDGDQMSKQSKTNSELKRIVVWTDNGMATIAGGQTWCDATDWSQKYDVDFESQNPNGDMHVEIAYNLSFVLSFLKHTLCT